MENELPRQEALIKKKQGAEYDESKQDILPNMGFVLNVTKLELDGAKNLQKRVQGTLKYLDSGTIRLAADCFMIFNVLNTSENAKPQHYLQYKLFKIQKNKTAMLYIKQNYIDISNRKVLLKEKGNREFTEDGNVVEGNETFDFEISISFN